MTHLSFGTNFGSLELLAADIWVMLYIHPIKGGHALRGYFGPPMRPKYENCFSQVSSY